MPTLATPSLGQTLLEPVQVSATSQRSVAARQVMPALPAGCWQRALDPLHWSPVQTLPSLVQAVPAGNFESRGHSPEEPVQTSAGSHSPPDDRHSVPAPATTSPGQVADVPVQVSAVSQIPLEGRHSVDADSNVQS